MLSGRIEQLVFVHPDSHMICSNIEIQLLNNICFNISCLVHYASQSKYNNVEVSNRISTMFHTAGVMLI